MLNTITILTTLLLLIIVLYICFITVTSREITRWGSKIATLSLFGLLLCCFAATRDGYYLSVQAAIDSSILPGTFTMDSIQSSLCSVGGALIAFSTLTSIVIKKEGYRKAVFFIIAVTIILKAIIVELSLIMLR